MKRLRLFGGFVFVTTILCAVGIVFGTPKVAAATITVDSGTDAVATDSTCHISEAIQNINDQAQTNNDCIAGDGNNDTINLPSGTISLSANLPYITESINIIGQGMNSSVINGNGFQGVSTSYSSVPHTKDINLESLTLTNISYKGIETNAARRVNILSIKVEDSGSGASITNAKDIIITDSIFNNNISTELVNESFAGLEIGVAGLTSDIRPTLFIENTKITDNTSAGENGIAGLQVSLRDSTLLDNNQFITSASIIISDVEITRNNGGLVAGLFMTPSSGPFSPIVVEFLVESSTIANNTVTVPVPKVVSSLGIPVIAGVYMAGLLNDQQNFNNVTVANNIANNPAPDNRVTEAGFFATFGAGSADLRITNATVVNNSSVQPATGFPAGAFSVLYMDLDISNYPTITVNEVRSGAKAQNSLIARNTNNGTPKNCLGNANLTQLGINVTTDATPTNLGSNLSDDQTCTGYDYVPNLYDTIQHDVADNGGPVPTIALLPNSPAIGAAGQVLGISTDARGIARPSNPDVGAYQTVLGTSTDTPLSSTISDVGVPNTGYGPKQESATLMSILTLISIITSLHIVIKRTLHKDSN